MGVTLYQASAGSGKTYTIVQAFLSLLFAAYPSHVDHQLRSILAITFTNKAAAHMKERILHALKKLAEGNTELYPEFWRQYPDLQKRASTILVVLLHNYGHFYVTTIDSFIQRLARSVAFELHLPLHFQVLLEKKNLFAEIIAELLDLFGRENSITELLFDFISYSVNSNSPSVETSLLRQAMTIYQEKNYLYLYPTISHQNFTYGSAFYQTIKKGYDRISYEREDAARKVIDEMTNYNITEKNIAYGGSGNLSFFKKILNRDTKDLRHESERLEKWLNKETSPAQTETWYKTYVLPFLEKYRILPRYNENDGYLLAVYEALLPHLFSLTLMNEFQKRLQARIRSLQIVPIEEFTRRLYEKISHDTIPYLYMKLGETHKYFFIDEFQDTSRLQWENLRPMIENAIAEGGHAYLVGDPKQAIYRWRNGDVRIMLENLFSQFHTVTTKSLDTNYRSRATIVNFINQFFGKLTSVLLFPLKSDSSQNDTYPLFTKSYEKLEQNPHTKEQGVVFVDVEIVSSKRLPPQTVEDPSPNTGINNEALSNEDEKDPSFFDHVAAWCHQQISQALAQGYQPQDIAILLRRNKDIPPLANYLLQHGIPVISSEALFVSNSIAIQLLLATMRLLLRPQDKNTLLAFLELYGQVFLLPLDPSLHKRFFDRINGDDPLAVLTALAPSHSAFEQCKTLLEDRLFLFTLSLYDLTEELVRRLNIASQKEHHTFLAKFFDSVRNFSFNGSGALADFLDEWETLAETLTIDPDESSSAVRIMSIHKAKGLEFPVVIVPILPLNKPRDKDILATIPVLKKHPLPLPDNHTWYWLYKSSENPLTYIDCLKKAYEEEKDLSLLDEVNTLYVALTRAKEALFVYIQLKATQDFSDFSAEDWKQNLKKYLNEKTKNKQLEEKIGHIVLHVLSETNNLQFLDAFRASLFIGRWSPPQRNSPTSSQNLLTSFPSSAWQGKMRVRRHDAEIHLLFHEKQKESQEKGIILHELLASIFSEQNIDRVVAIYKKNLPGELSETIEHDVKSMLQEVWNIFVTRGWINGYTIHNEETLLTPLGLIRPDKVFLKQDNTHAIVVDYKSGLQSSENVKQTLLNRYREQLQTYCNAIASMGYKTVEGYILHLATRTLHKVV